MSGLRRFAAERFGFEGHMAADADAEATPPRKRGINQGPMGWEVDTRTLARMFTADVDLREAGRDALRRRRNR